MVITEQTPIQQTGRPPWGFRQALVLQAMVILAAFVLQAALPRLLKINVALIEKATGKPFTFSFPTIAVPWNWVIALSLIILAIILGAAFRKAAWMRWLSGAGFAIANVVLVAVISLFGTIIVQDSSIKDGLTRFGLHALFTSIPFAISLLFMMLNLSLVIGRRFMTPGPGFLGFMLNHVGLLIVLLAAFPGKAQHVEAFVQLPEGATSDLAWDDTGKEHKLGASVTLNKFEIEKYPPKLAIAENYEDGTGQDGHNHAEHKQRLATATQWPAKGRQFQAYGVKVKYLEFLPMAMPANMDFTEWAPVGDHGLPAAKVEITAPDGKKTTEWIVAQMSSIQFPGRVAQVDEHHFVGLLEPSPKEFRSHLTILEKGATTNRVLKVNDPIMVGGRTLLGKFRVGGWHLYQSSYEMGMSGRVSIIQAVRDPALPLVYTGLVCMIIGAIIAFWLTPQRRKNGAFNQDSEEASAQ